MTRFHPRTWDDGVMPLEEFPPEKREAIERAVALEWPPQRWLDFGLVQIESRAWWEWHWARGRKLWSVGEPERRPHIPRSIRLAVYERDGWKCLHCDSPDRLSLDHIHPWSMGGPDTIDNLQTLCKPCNSRKGARI